MGKYDDLTELERKFLLELAEKSSLVPNLAWNLVPRQGLYELLPTTVAEKTTSVPDAGIRGFRLPRSFFDGLESAGYCTLASTPSYEPTLTIRQPTLDYATYAAKSCAGRWWADFSHDLGHDTSLRSKTAWLLLAVLVSTAVNIAIKFLGLLD